MVQDAPLAGPPPDVWDRDRVVDECIQEASERGVPAALLLTGAIAESGADAVNDDRYGTLTGWGKDIVTLAETYGIDTPGEWGLPGDGETGRDAWAALMAKTWPDVSFGVGQQICLFAPVGDGTRSFENVMLVREWLSNPANAVPLMADKLAAFYRIFRVSYDEDEAIRRSLYRYNTGNIDGTPPGGQWAGNVAGYERALVAARAILRAR